MLNQTKKKRSPFLIIEDYCRLKKHEKATDTAADATTAAAAAVATVLEEAKSVNILEHQQHQPLLYRPDQDKKTQEPNPSSPAPKVAVTAAWLEKNTVTANETVCLEREGEETDGGEGIKKRWKYDDGYEGISPSHEDKGLIWINDNWVGVVVGVVGGVVILG